jgi:hypothetical protein
MLVVEHHQFENSAARVVAAKKTFEGPGQKQIGTAGHAPSPSIQTLPAADGRPKHSLLFLSRPTFSGPAISLRRLSQHVRRIHSA